MEEPAAAGGEIAGDGIAGGGIHRAAAVADLAAKTSGGGGIGSGGVSVTPSVASSALISADLAVIWSRIACMKAGDGFVAISITDIINVGFGAGGFAGS